MKHEAGRIVRRVKAVANLHHYDYQEEEEMNVVTCEMTYESLLPEFVFFHKQPSGILQYESIYLGKMCYVNMKNLLKYFLYICKF